ncbi:MAG TPA: hypothetical protein VD927_06630 [Chryseosolibacter sp.]|nr:hypothetical protein [Chryseosolibacter sp.]
MTSDLIKLSGKDYPIRFDMAALKEYKAITNNDVLSGFENTTDNIITLAYCVLKSGHRFNNPTNEFQFSIEQVSGLIEVADIPKITKKLLQSLGIDVDKINKQVKEIEPTDESGEVYGIA